MDRCMKTLMQGWVDALERQGVGRPCNKAAEVMVRFNSIKVRGEAAEMTASARSVFQALILSFDAIIADGKVSEENLIQGFSVLESYLSKRGY